MGGRYACSCSLLLDDYTFANWRVRTQANWPIVLTCFVSCPGFEKEGVQTYQLRCYYPYSAVNWAAVTVAPGYQWTRLVSVHRRELHGRTNLKIAMVAAVGRGEKNKQLDWICREKKKGNGGRKWRLFPTADLSITLDCQSGFGDAALRLFACSRLVVVMNPVRVITSPFRPARASQIRS